MYKHVGHFDKEKLLINLNPWPWWITLLFSMKKNLACQSRYIIIFVKSRVQTTNYEL